MSLKFKRGLEYRHTVGPDGVLPVSMWHTLAVTFSLTDCFHTCCCRQQLRKPPWFLPLDIVTFGWCFPRKCGTCDTNGIKVVRYMWLCMHDDMITFHRRVVPTMLVFLSLADYAEASGHVGHPKWQITVGVLWELRVVSGQQSTKIWSSQSHNYKELDAANNCVSGEVDPGDFSWS